MIKVFSIYDKVSAIYSQPFYLKSIPVAIREITSLVNDKSQPNLFNTNINDKTLILIGEFDEETGELNPLEKHQIINNLSDYVQNEQ